MKTSDEMGGREVTLRLRLYRLKKKVADELASNKLSGRERGCYSLPVALHVALLEVTVSKRHLTCVTCVRVGGGSIDLRTAASVGPTPGDGSHDDVGFVESRCVK